MGELFPILFALFIGLLLIKVFWINRTKRLYLESLKFPMVPPFLCFGSPPFSLHKILVHEWRLSNHRKFGKTWTMYMGAYPAIVTIDPDLVKCVMIKNFDCFTDSLDFEFPEEKMLLSVAQGELWRDLRNKLSPTFTSGKLKAMIRPMEDVADQLVRSVEKRVDRGSTVEVKDLYQAYALDTIARCAFGVDTSAIDKETHPILENGRQISSVFVCSNFLMSLFLFVSWHWPALLKLISFFPKSFDNLYDLTKQIVSERDESKIEVGDFIDRLRDLLKEIKPPLTEKIIYAQGVLFFGAGFETTSSTLSSFSYHLAMNPDIQEKIYKEINDVLEASDGKITHETITQMHYLEAALNENLRLCPPLADSLRLCTKDCTINGINIAAGTNVIMPIWASHHLEEYFPEPEIFRPERFLRENSDQIKPFTWRPFGEGARACLGKRFAMSEMKMCLAKLLHKFKIEKTPETKLVLSKGGIPFFHFDKIFVNFVPR